MGAANDMDDVAGDTFLTESRVRANSVDPHAGDIKDAGIS